MFVVNVRIVTEDLYTKFVLVLFFGEAIVYMDKYNNP